MSNPIAKKSVRQLLEELCEANWSDGKTSPSNESIRRRVDLTEREILRRLAFAKKLAGIS